MYVARLRGGGEGVRWWHGTEFTKYTLCLLSVGFHCIQPLCITTLVKFFSILLAK